MNFFAAINPGNQPATRDPKFYSELKQLNDDFVSLLDKTHKKSPYFDFTPTLNDYIRQFNELEKQYPAGSSGATKTPFETKSQPLTFGGGGGVAGGATGFSFGNISSNIGAGLNTNNNNNIGLNTSAFGITTTGINTNNTTGTGLFNSAPNNTTNADEGTKEESDEESAPPEPQIDKYEEPDAKYQIRCKLYERVRNNGVASFSHIGTGVFYVKQYETNKLQIIVRLEPDLRRVILNGILTPDLPLKQLDKSVHFMLPASNNESKLYVAKVNDSKVATELYEQLTTIRNQIVTSKE